MEKHLFTHKLSNGKKIKVLEVEILGQYTHNVDISISPRLKNRLQLEVFLHEGLHSEFPRLSEKEVDIKAISLSKYLWKAGYRKNKK